MDLRRRTKHQASKRKKAASPSPPPSPPSDPTPDRAKGKGIAISSKLLTPKSADLDSLASWFPQIKTFAEEQGWTEFLCAHRTYYPHLVQEFFEHLELDESTNFLYSTVKGTRFQLTYKLIRAALNIPRLGASYEGAVFDHDDAHAFMLGRPITPEHPAPSKLNAHHFPPVPRMLHSLISHILIPKGGSYGDVTDIHKFLFFHVFRHEPVNFVQIFLETIGKCAYNKNRSWPYACHLTAIFKSVKIPLAGEYSLTIQSKDIWDLDKARKKNFSFSEGVVSSSTAPAAPPDSRAPPAPASASSDCPPPPPPTFPQEWTSHFQHHFGSIEDSISRLALQVEGYQSHVDRRLDELDDKIDYAVDSIGALRQDFQAAFPPSQPEHAPVWYRSWDDPPPSPPHQSFAPWGQ